MTILTAAMTHIRHNDVLLAAIGLNAEEMVQQLRDDTALYSDTFACGEVARKIALEAQHTEESADPELGDSQREIARMLRILSHNLGTRIRFEQEPLPVR